MEEEYYQLRRRLEDGSISRPEYERAVANLRIRDGLGREWQIEPSSGKWFLAGPRTGIVAPESEIDEPEEFDSEPETISPSRGVRWIQVIAILLIIAFAIFDILGLMLLTKTGPFGIIHETPVGRPVDVGSLSVVPSPTATLLPPPAPTSTPTAPAPAPTLARQTVAVPTAAPLVNTTDSAPATSALKQLYIISMRTEPAPPKRQQNVTFIPTLIDTTSTAISGKWVINIFHSSGQGNPFGQTTSDRVTHIPPGTVEVPTVGS